MRVFINSFELTGDDNVERVSGFVINGSLVADMGEFIRAESAVVFNRRNARTAISFSVARLHSSTGDAEDYILKHQTDIPEQGLVRLKASDNTERYLENAMVQVVESTYMGKSTFHRYQIIGGKMLKERP